MNPLKSIAFWLSLDAFWVAGLLWLSLAMAHITGDDRRTITSVADVFWMIGGILIAVSVIRSSVAWIKQRHAHS